MDQRLLGNNEGEEENPNVWCSDALQVNKGFLITLTLFACLGGFLFGFDTGVIGGAMLYLKVDFGIEDNSVIQEVIVSSSVIGAIFGSLGGGMLTKKCGRRGTILIACVIFIVGALDMGFSFDVPQLIVGRVLVGIGVGLASMAVPMYVAESAPKEVRGGLVSLDIFFITFGSFSAYGIDLLFSSFKYNWRWMLGFGAVPALLQLVGMFFLPESPRWLIEVGKKEEGQSALVRARGDIEFAAVLVEEVEESIAIEKIEAVRRMSEEKSVGNLQETGDDEVDENPSQVDMVRILFRDPVLRRMMVVGIGLQVIQQLAGINSVLYYLSTIIQEVGIEGDEQAILWSMGVTGLNMVMTLVAVLKLDSFGRRAMLLVTLPLIALGLFILAAGLALDRPAIALSGLFFYSLVFAPGMGPVPWVYCSEIFPLYLRGTANGITSCASWTSNLLISLTFLTLINTVSAAGAFALYGIFAIGGLFFVFFLMPETKGRKLEEMPHLFAQPHYQVLFGDEK